MKGIKTFVRALTLDAVNAAFRNADVAKVPEVDFITITFTAPHTPLSFNHGLGKVPEFARILGEGTGQLYATSADKALWTDKTVVLRCGVAITAILAVEAR